MEFLIVLAILVLVVFVITAPLRRDPAERTEVGASLSSPAGGRAEELDELDAAREAKYREIRDAELDHATGKLSDGDHQALDARLRTEAMEILRRIDRLRAADPALTPETDPDERSEGGAGSVR